jgi:hypothetical protein
MIKVASEVVDVTMDECNYFEPVKSSLLSHVCMTPVEYHSTLIGDCAAIMTRA